MGENFLEEQVKHCEKRRRIAQGDVKRRTFFARPEITSTVYTVTVDRGSTLKEDETYLAAVSADGQRIHVADGNRIVGRIEGDGAKVLAKGLDESGHPGAVPLRVTEVSPLSGFGKAVIVTEGE